METLKTDATNTPLQELLDQYKDHSKTPAEEIIEDATVEVMEDTSSHPTIINNSQTVIFTEDGISKSKAEETVNAIVSVIEEYNQKYNLTLPTEIDDVKKIIYGIASRRDRDMYAVALSEVADRVTLATVTSLLITISTLCEQLSSQAFLNALTVQERVAILREFLDYIMKLNEIRESLKVQNPDIEIRNAIKAAKQDKLNRSNTSENKKIDEILEILRRK
jgi:hypothetical protein